MLTNHSKVLVVCYVLDFIKNENWTQTVSNTTEVKKYSKLVCGLVF